MGENRSNVLLEIVGAIFAAIWSMFMVLLREIFRP